MGPFTKELNEPPLGQVAKDERVNRLTELVVSSPFVSVRIPSTLKLLPRVFMLPPETVKLLH
jgi:hypothetical protein